MRDVPHKPQVLCNHKTAWDRPPTAAAAAEQ